MIVSVIRVLRMMLPGHCEAVFLNLTCMLFAMYLMTHYLHLQSLKHREMLAKDFLDALSIPQQAVPEGDQCNRHGGAKPMMVSLPFRAIEICLTCTCSVLSNLLTYLWLLQLI